MSNEKVHRIQSEQATAVSCYLMSELTSSEQFSPKGQNMIFEQSHSPFSMNWGSTYGVTPEGKNFTSPKSFSFHVSQSQRNLIMRQNQGECSEFNAPLEQVFPEENISSAKPSKDIFTLQDFQRRMIPVPVFKEALAITNSTYKGRSLPSTLLSGDFQNSSSLITRKFGRTLGMRSRKRGQHLKFLGTSAHTEQTK